MATYKSDKVDILSSAHALYRKVENPENLRQLLSSIPAEQIPEEQRKQLEQIEVTPDSIVLPGGPVGSVTLRVAERQDPTLVRFEGVGMPVKMELLFKIYPLNEEMCQAQVELELDVPMMLKPMINGPMQKMVNQFSNLLRHLGNAPAAE